MENSDEFLEDLQSEDELGAVIRAHLYIEHYVDEIVDLLVPFSNELKPLKLDYDGKLCLIAALGVKPEIKKPLSTIGKIRNKFAHQPKFELTDNEVNNLYSSLGSEDKELFNKLYKQLDPSVNEGRQLPSYKELSPKEKFILLAVVLRTLAKMTRDELAEKQSA